MAAVVSAISGTIVIPGASAPPLPPFPPDISIKGGTTTLDLPYSKVLIAKSIYLHERTNHNSHYYIAADVSSISGKH